MATIKAIEQKAQRYDEALEKLRSLHDNYDTVSTLIDIKEELENIFPELKESEDEKIRKAIYNCVKWFGFDSIQFKYVSQENCLAWLEKQGKNNMGISGATKKKLEDNLNKALEKETAESFNEFLDEQGKQKSVEWSEEDEYCLDGAIETEMYMLDVVNGIKKFDVGNESIKEECTKELNWLKSLKDRVQPQPKQEWSKEDEDILNTIINHFKIDIECTDEDDVIRWLKSLRPQSTWKPTEQQMKVLNEVINFAADHGTMRWNDYIYNVLKGLREQLKKLTE